MHRAWISSLRASFCSSSWSNEMNVSEMGLVKTFLSSTSAHGFGKTIQENCLRRWIWVFICVCCYSATMVFIIKVIQEANDPDNIVNKINATVVNSSQSEFLTFSCVIHSIDLLACMWTCLMRFMFMSEVVCIQWKQILVKSFLLAMANILLTNWKYCVSP